MEQLADHFEDDQWLKLKSHYLRLRQWEQLIQLFGQRSQSNVEWRQGTFERLAAAKSRGLEEKRLEMRKAIEEGQDLCSLLDPLK
jgi:hypothetical protein